MDHKKTLQKITLAIMACQIVLALLGIWHKRVHMRVVDAAMREEWTGKVYRRT